nr:1,5-anhydro-D-fructose reductase-like isoform X1 [Leptinotarsa decemlineata]
MLVIFICFGLFSIFFDTSIAVYCSPTKKMNSVPSFELGNGRKIPSIGFGTWMMTNSSAEEAVKTALSTGYRHIDTAHAYGNEEVIGKVLKEWISSGKISRNEIFVTTKLPPNGMNPGRVATYLKRSLDALQLEYVDMYLIHTPFGFTEVEGELFRTLDDGSVDIDVSTDLVEIWKAMEKQYDLGLAKAIGISNFNKSQIERIIGHCRTIPHNLQTEHHIYLQQPELIEFCRKNNIVVTSYSSLGNRGLSALGQDIPDILSNPTVLKMSKKYNKTPAQILLRHIHQKNIVVIPKSKNPERIRENFNIFDFQLDSQDMKELNDLNRDLKLLNFELMFKGVKKHPEYPF